MQLVPKEKRQLLKEYLDHSLATFKAKQGLGSVGCHDEQCGENSSDCETKLSWGSNISVEEPRRSTSRLERKYVKNTPTALRVLIANKDCPVCMEEKIPSKSENWHISPRNRV